MTVNQAINKLMQLQLQGLGEYDIQVLQYNGGDDVPCDVTEFTPQFGENFVMLETQFVN